MNRRSAILLLKYYKLHFKPQEARRVLTNHECSSRNGGIPSEYAEDPIIGNLKRYSKLSIYKTKEISDNSAVINITLSLSKLYPRI